MSRKLNWFIEAGNKERLPFPQKKTTLFLKYMNNQDIQLRSYKVNARWVKTVVDAT